MNSGRWMKHQYKNPNEQDHDDLLHELEQFPDKIREEVWIKDVIKGQFVKYFIKFRKSFYNL